MQANVGGIDQKLRITIGIVLFVISATTNLIGLWGLLGIIPIITGVMRFCPLYPILGINTGKA
jgi:membrane-bound ClpP family serine protease